MPCGVPYYEDSREYQFDLKIEELEKKLHEQEEISDSNIKMLIDEIRHLSIKNSELTVMVCEITKLCEYNKFELSSILPVHILDWIGKHKKEDEERDKE